MSSIPLEVEKRKRVSPCCRLAACAQLFALLLILAATEAGAQVPNLLKDLNGVNAGSTPSYKVEMGGMLYFSAFEPDHGRELWRSDGTSAGTKLVKDLVPGPDWGISRPVVVGGDRLLFFLYEVDRDSWDLWTSDGTARGSKKVIEVPTGGRAPWLLPASGRVFFGIEYSVLGGQLWTSDGTAEGTERIAEGFDGLNSFFAVGDRMVFVANDRVHGNELWTTDGSRDGTFMLRDIRSGSEGSYPRWAVAHEGSLYFSADDGVHGMELWTSDGTKNGTYLVKDLAPGPAPAEPGAFTALNGELYFLTRELPHLWITDGTEAGTRVAVKIPGADYLYWPTLVDGRLFFTSNEYELWTSDGTQDGTRFVASVGEGYTGPRDLTEAGGRVFFIADDGIHGVELWSSDGTESGTRMAKDIGPPGQAPFFYFKYTGDYIQSFEFDDRLVFIANDGRRGYELWISNGTESGTFVLKDIKPGAYDAEVGLFLELDGRLYFNADDGVHGDELWSTNGSRGGTVLVKDIDSKGTLSSSPTEFTGMEGVLYFTADDCSFECPDRDYSTGNDLSDRELWRSDGTAAGTFRVRDINPEGPSFPTYLVAAGSGLFFFASDGTHGSELWTSDGTRRGTRLVDDLEPGPESLYAHDLVAVGDRVFFSGYSSESGRQLYVSDGTELGTRFVSPPEEFRWPDRLHALGELVIFQAEDSVHGEELWVSDGSDAGTRLLKDAWPGEAPGYPSAIGKANGRLLLHIRDEVHGRELWVSDGTPEGTRLVKDIWEGPEDSYPEYALGALDGKLFFWAEDGVHGDEIWASDGTADGTYLVKDIQPGSDSSMGYGTGAVLDGRIYFAAGDGRGIELWSTDGTDEGTYRVKDINPGAESSFPNEFHEFDGRVYFAANDGVHGSELWSTDGTRSGTVLVADLDPGHTQSWPQQFESVDGHLFFTASSKRSGQELWVLRAGSATAGLPKLLTLPDLDGLGGDELAILGSNLAVRDAASGVAISAADFAPSHRWEAVDFELATSSADDEPTELAVLTRLRKQVQISVRNALNGAETSSIELTSKHHPLDLEVVPANGGGPTRAAVLSRRGLGKQASVLITPFGAQSSDPLEFALPEAFDAVDLEVTEIPKPIRGRDKWGLVVLGRSSLSGSMRLLTLDAGTGQTIGDATIDGKLVPIDLEIVQEDPKKPEYASVLARRRKNGAIRMITVNLLDGSVTRIIRSRKKRLPLDLEIAPGPRDSAGPNVSILWTDKSGTKTGLSTRNAFTGKQIGSVIFKGVQHPEDFSLVRLPGRKVAAAVLGEAECADLQLAITLRDTASGDLVGCYPAD
ncbi:MAG: hypothetical protein GY769_10810 [bacterium]|nr:hypothetical protein [bacterium]